VSYRDVEELLAERGLDVSYETLRRWVLKFGPQFARRLRARRPRPSSSKWHLDEMVVAIGGRQLWLWRAVDLRSSKMKAESVQVVFVLPDLLAGEGRLRRTAGELTLALLSANF
jgi:hypothetical protein